VASFALFVVSVIWGEHGREPLFSQVGVMFAAAGFGIAGATGGIAFLAIRGLRLPNRWADRRRAPPPPNQSGPRLNLRIGERDRQSVASSTNAKLLGHFYECLDVIEVRPLEVTFSVFGN
jgi:hypothetical protein